MTPVTPVTPVTLVDVVILMDVVDVVDVVTGTPKSLMATLLHGIHPKQTTVHEARVLRTMAVMMAGHAPPVRPRTIHTRRHRVRMPRQIRLR